MTEYATRVDVLRELGGTLQTLKSRFGSLLWTGDVTSVTVDTLDIDVPDAVLARIDVQLENANSLVNTYVLQGYQTTPTTVPAHLRAATAKLAAYSSVTTDGVRPEYLRSMESHVKDYLGKLSKGELDLGLVSATRPLMRRPSAKFFTTAGGACS